MIIKTTFATTFLTLILISTTTISPLTATVYDSAGHKLLRGIPYYILPLLSGSGGGLTLSRTTTTATCPLDVTQEPFQLNRGAPFTFHPILLDESSIRDAYPITIEADVTNPCTGSKIWKMTSSKKDGNNILSLKDSNSKKKDDKDKDKDKDKDVGDDDIVTTGGEFNKPESCFQIVEDVMMPGLRSYQIQNCPFKCGSGGNAGFTCYNVGVVGANGHLGRTDVMFPVVFVSSSGVASE